jgi:hypothetical protein
MAIQQVILPQRPQSRSSSSDSIFGSIGKAGQILGTVGALSGNPILSGIGAAATTGSNLLDTPKQPEVQKEPKLVETRDMAMNRRMNLQEENPEESLDYGIAAIETLNIPDEQKQRLLKPMLMAKQARV